MRDRSREYYARLFATMRILPDWHDDVCRIVRRIRRSWDRYTGFDSPAALIAVVHNLECNGDFDRQILNGELWKQQTILVPSSLGPWDSWAESTVDALANYALQNLHDLEAWNGWGYARRGVNSPYLWSGSNHGVGVGKYTSDGHYDPQAVSGQIGAALILPALGYEDAT